MKPNHFTSHSNIELKPVTKINLSIWYFSVTLEIYQPKQFYTFIQNTATISMKKIMVLCWGYIGATKFNFKMELFEYWQIWKKDLAI
jgi:hypothetical protein